MLKNMKLSVDGTLGVTGGTTTLDFIDNGISIANGVQLINADGAFDERFTVTAKVKGATLNPQTGQYGKDKKSISITRPVELADGRIVFNTIRIERELHPSTDANSALAFNKYAAQCLFDTDTEMFWLVGSLS